MTNVQTSHIHGNEIGWPKATSSGVASSRGAASMAASNDWSERLRRYCVGSARRGIAELAVTAIGFLASLGGTIALIERHVMLALLLSPVTAALIVRLFTIQHDCGHRSFFRWAAANDWLGRAIGIVTLTPYAAWRRAHAHHHAGSGNLARRGVGDIWLITVREYGALPRWRQLAYRLYRHPLSLFVVGPTLQYWILYRLPLGLSPGDLSGWMSVFGLNLAIGAVAACIQSTVGLGVFLLAYFPAAVLAASVGVWLFHVQHHFEGAYWRHPDQWDFRAAALEGSTLYELPAVLHWLTSNICYHHIHHLSSRIPGYRLRACFKAIPELQTPKRITVRESLKHCSLILWDERRGRMVSLDDRSMANA